MRSGQIFSSHSSFSISSRSKPRSSFTSMNSIWSDEEEEEDAVDEIGIGIEGMAPKSGDGGGEAENAEEETENPRMGEFGDGTSSSLSVFLERRRGFKRACHSSLESSECSPALKRSRPVGGGGEGERLSSWRYMSRAPEGGIETESSIKALSSAVGIPSGERLSSSSYPTSSTVSSSSASESETGGVFDLGDMLKEELKKWKKNCQGQSVKTLLWDILCEL